MVFVYVLQSRKNGRLYTGFTSDLEKRLAEHNSGHTKSIRYVRPFDLLYFESCASRLDASRRERYLKSGVGREEFKSILAQKKLAGA